MDTASSDAAAYWRLRARAPWGDYGKILVHGMSTHLPRIDGKIQLERTAPFIPPLTLPGISDLVVTGDLRALLEREGLSSAMFQPLNKAHIVRLNWTDWDRSAELPPILPGTGEPEDYLLANQHDPSAALALGDLWELLPERGGIVARQEVSQRPRRYQYALQPGTEPNADLFRAENMRAVLVTPRMRSVLEAAAGDALGFDAVIVGDLPLAPPPERHYLHRKDEPVPDGYEVTSSFASPFTGEIVRIATPRKR